MIKEYQRIVDVLPYDRPFLFVDKIISIDENGVVGEYTFRKDEYFYRGHFKGRAVTPGVILVECMAQIGLVTLAIYLNGDLNGEIPAMAFSSFKTDFLKMVLPGEKVRVESTKRYLRFGKLNCDVKMYNEVGEEVCRGNLSGVVLNKKIE